MSIKLSLYYKIFISSFIDCGSEACITLGGISLPKATSTAQSFTSDGFGKYSLPHPTHTKIAFYADIF